MILDLGDRRPNACQAEVIINNYTVMTTEISTLTDTEAVIVCGDKSLHLKKAGRYYAGRDGESEAIVDSTKFDVDCAIALGAMCINCLNKKEGGPLVMSKKSKAEPELNLDDMEI